MQAFVARRMLKEDGLREIDRHLLDFLQESRITPVYARERITDDGIRKNITNEYLQQRLKRFEEHGHVRNLYDIGLYELVSDPREEK